eukprot:1091225-Prymnesium_polylepis.1
MPTPAATSAWTTMSTYPKKMPLPGPPSRSQTIERLACESPEREYHEDSGCASSLSVLAGSSMSSSAGSYSPLARCAGRTPNDSAAGGSGLAHASRPCAALYARSRSSSCPRQMTIATRVRDAITTTSLP